MKIKEYKGIKVIEVPYRNVTKTYEKRELDDYKLCGTYYKGDVPFKIVQANYDENKYNDDESKIFEAYGELCGNICEETKLGLKNDYAIVLTGGGCGHMIGVLGGMQQVYGKDKDIGLIYIDAHGDFNTPETTLTNIIGGYPLAVISGLCCDEWRLGGGLEVPIKNDNIILTDGRNLDMLEEKALKKANITLINTESFNDKDIWKKSIDSFVDKVDVICVHIDEDILDIKHVPNHRTPEPNGPDIYTAIENIRYIMSTGKVAAYSLLSVYHGDKNPGNEISTLNGMRLLGSALESWREYPSLSNI